jgi:hypothetical protein
VTASGSRGWRPSYHYHTCSKISFGIHQTSSFAAARSFSAAGCKSSARQSPPLWGIESYWRRNAALRGLNSHIRRAGIATVRVLW